MHCSLSAFLVGFHVHEKALLVPAIVSALLAFQSRAGARMYLRLSFLAAFAVFPLLPGPELRPLKASTLLSFPCAFCRSCLLVLFPKRFVPRDHGPRPIDSKMSCSHYVTDQASVSRLPMRFRSKHTLASWARAWLDAFLAGIKDYGACFYGSRWRRFKLAPREELKTLLVLPGVV